MGDETIPVKTHTISIAVGSAASECVQSLTQIMERYTQNLLPNQQEAIAIWFYTNYKTEGEE